MSANWCTGYVFNVFVFVIFLQLDRHMRRLEHDLNRFTIELEADTAGITEILEQSKCHY